MAVLAQNALQTLTLIEKLRFKLARLKRQQFGTSSERRTFDEPSTGDDEHSPDLVGGGGAGDRGGAGRDVVGCSAAPERIAADTGDVCIMHDRQASCLRPRRHRRSR